MLSGSRADSTQLEKDEVAKTIAELLGKMKPYIPEVEVPKRSVKATVTMPRPPPRPFSSNTNPDAIAIRAAASLLQTQKAKAKQDIQRLEDLKAAALAEPELFVEALSTGELRSNATGTLGPTLEGVVGSLAGEQSSKSSESLETLHPRFPSMPTPQNIVRMPPVNWAQYGIVGDSLDKLHEEQRTRPTLGEPEHLDTRTSQPSAPVEAPGGERAPKHVLAAPYNPLADR